MSNENDLVPSFEMPIVNETIELDKIQGARLTLLEQTALEVMHNLEQRDLDCAQGTKYVVTHNSALIIHQFGDKFSAKTFISPETKH